MSITRFAVARDIAVGIFLQMASWLTDVVANHDVDRFVGLHENRAYFRGKNDLDASVVVQKGGIIRDTLMTTVGGAEITRKKFSAQFSSLFV